MKADSSFPVINLSKMRPRPALPGSSGNVMPRPKNKMQTRTQPTIALRWGEHGRVAGRPKTMYKRAFQSSHASVDKGRYRHDYAEDVEMSKEELLSESLWRHLADIQDIQADLQRLQEIEQPPIYGQLLHSIHSPGLVCKVLKRANDTYTRLGLSRTKLRRPSSTFVHYSKVAQPDNPRLRLPLPLSMKVPLQIPQQGKTALQLAFETQPRKFSDLQDPGHFKKP